MSEQAIWIKYRDMLIRLKDEIAWRDHELEVFRSKAAAYDTIERISLLRNSGGYASAGENIRFTIDDEIAGAKAQIDDCRKGKPAPEAPNKEKYSGDAETN